MIYILYYYIVTYLSLKLKENYYANAGLVAAERIGYPSDLSPVITMNTPWKWLTIHEKAYKGPSLNL